MFNNASKKNSSQAKFLILSSAIGFLLFLTLAYKLNLTDTPTSYSWDAIYFGWAIQRIKEAELFSLTPFSSSLRQGFPFDSSFYDFPQAEIGSGIFVKLVSMLGIEWNDLFSIYYLTGFYATFFATFLILNRFHFSRFSAIIGSSLYSLLPFYFERSYHLFLTWYFVIPLLVWESWKLSQSTLFNLNCTWRCHVQDFFGIAVSACFGVYYAVFGLVMFLLAGVDAWLRSGKQTIKNTIRACILIVGVLCVQISPNLIFWFQHGRNSQALLRSASQTEFYGLKIIQLILPHSNHRSLLLDQINQSYGEQFSWFVNENSHAALGLLGSIGFLTLIVLVLFRLDLPRRTEQIRFFGMITLGMILIGTVGGFSSGISLISPMIRSWNRVSVVIAFCAIATFLTLLEMLTDYLKRRGVRQSMIRLLLVSILVFGLWEQSPRPCPECQQAIAAEFQGDRDYFRQVEATLPKGAAIYQLPYFSFPEGEIAYRVKSYDFFRGYLHTKDLKWNLGGTRGREGDRFYAQLSKQPIPEQIAAIRKLGFSAILVDRYGYAEGDRSTEQALLDSGQVEPDRLVSANGRFSLYRLKPKPAEAA